jgi:Cu(I)/Ag(I) efflux system membrane fusion protein
MKIKRFFIIVVLFSLVAGCADRAGGVKMTTAGDSIQLGMLLTPANAFVLASLPVVAAEEKALSMPVTAYGTVEYDTRISGSIAARVAGRIEKLYVRYRYQPVSAGQKIMDIYSPELLTAQQELLFLLREDAGNASLIRASKEKLLLLGMKGGQLQEVIREGKPLYAIGVYSNYAGHVHDAGMASEAEAGPAGVTKMTGGVNNGSAPLTGELSLKEGMYVRKGQTLVMIMDHRRAWAALQIFSGDQSLVKRGDRVQIVPETDTTAMIDGQIDFIEPFLRSSDKTLTVRVYFHNLSMLPIGSHVTATIYTGAARALWLPQTAVLSLGMKQVVFVKAGDGFLAHAIVTGLRSGQEVQVVSGLNATDSVAENAAYLVDNDSFIKTSSK